MLFPDEFIIIIIFYVQEEASCQLTRDQTEMSDFRNNLQRMLAL